MISSYLFYLVFKNWLANQAHIGKIMEYLLKLCLANTIMFF